MCQPTEINFSPEQNFVMSEEGVKEGDVISEINTTKAQSLPNTIYGTTAISDGVEDSDTCDNDDDDATIKRTTKSSERFISTSSTSIPRRKSLSTSPKTTGHPQQHQQLTLHQHQPQIHHHHWAASPATMPSPVKMPTVPSAEHLF